MTGVRGVDDAPRSGDGKRVTVLAIVDDEPTRALLPRVLAGERLIIAGDPVRGLAFADSEAPDIVFVDIRIGSGAGLAMVHHLKAVAPETHVFAMATKETLEAGAQAVALGGAGLVMLPLGGDEILSAVETVKVRLAERAARAELEEQIAKLLAAQEEAALALQDERERLRGLAAMKDASSSAYSFAYYVDIAGRELYKASRFGRRLSVLVIGLDQNLLEIGQGQAAAPKLTPITAADHLLTIAPDMAVLARVDEDELHLLLPETNGLGAHAARRRAIAHLAQAHGDAKTLIAPRGVLAGVATFPHDGQDLLKLQRVARRRADESCESVVHRVGPEQTGVSDILDALKRAAAHAPGPFARAIELPIGQVAALTSVLLAEAIRGGGVHAVVTYHPEPNLFSTVRFMLGGQPRPGITFRALDIRNAPDCADLEALCIMAEQGAYALIGRVHTGVFRGVHSADPLLVDALTERIGRAAGIRLFT